MSPLWLSLLPVAAAIVTVTAPSRSADAPANRPVPTTAVVAVVRIPAPWYAPRFLIRRKMRATVAPYEALPGLLYKAFTISDDKRFGGVYLWTDRAAAEGWFSLAWRARVREERGADADVRIFDAPIVLDTTPGGTPAQEGRAVATLALSSAPREAAREALVAGFEAARASDESLTGLLRRYYVIADDGRTGAVSIWTDRAAAERALGATDAEWYDAPILAPSHLPVSQE